MPSWEDFLLHFFFICIYEVEIFAPLVYLSLRQCLEDEERRGRQLAELRFGYSNQHLCAVGGGGEKS